jgi:hypothetical protein
LRVATEHTQRVIDGQLIRVTLMSLDRCGDQILLSLQTLRFTQLLRSDWCARTVWQS